ncbi:Uncharacterized protein PBTT_09790 [Plasmodiophora brassicae]
MRDGLAPVAVSVSHRRRRHRLGTTGRLYEAALSPLSSSASGHDPLRCHRRYSSPASASLLQPCSLPTGAPRFEDVEILSSAQRYHVYRTDEQNENADQLAHGFHEMTERCTRDDVHYERNTSAKRATGTASRATTCLLGT